MCQAGATSFLMQTLLCVNDMYACKAMLQSANTMFCGSVNAIDPRSHPTQCPW